MSIFIIQKFIFRNKQKKGDPKVSVITIIFFYHAIYASAASE